MEEYEREGMIDSLRCRRDEPVQYVAPGAEQRWRARDLVDIHWELVGMPTPSPSYNRIMSCIIGHANPTTGRCQVKQKLIAAETGYCVKTVRRVIDWWVAHGFLIEQDMGLAKSRAYHPQWDLFELHWIAIAEDIKAGKESWRGNSTEPPMDIKGSIDGGHQGVHRDGHHAVQHESQRGISKDESHPEWARPPSVADVNIVHLNEEGIQRGEVESASTNSQRHEGPSYEKAYVTVSGYCDGFHWDNLSEQDFEAAVAAERREAGAGRPVINEAAMAAFCAKRKGGANE
jgi:hypothetical protein